MFWWNRSQRRSRESRETWCCTNHAVTAINSLTFAFEFEKVSIIFLQFWILKLCSLAQLLTYHPVRCQYCQVMEWSDKLCAQYWLGIKAVLRGSCHYKELWLPCPRIVCHQFQVGSLELLLSNQNVDRAYLGQDKLFNLVLVNWPILRRSDGKTSEHISLQRSHQMSGVNVQF